MGISSIALINIGSSVSKTLLKLWLQDSVIAKNIACETSDIIGKKITNILTVRKAGRFFERISEAIAVEMKNIFKSADIQDKINDEEKEAVAQTLIDIFNKTVFSNDILIEKDLSSFKLTEYLLRNNDELIKPLSPYLESILRKLLIESCNYIIEIVTTLPDFNTVFAQEVLERESSSMALIQQVIDKLPSSRYKGHEESDSEFETEYCRRIALKLDYVELFGLNLKYIKPRYNLSTAYISLKLSDETSHNVSDSGIRAENFLSLHRRVLVRGEAGSGKTTLLQWIAVTATRNEFAGGLKKWNKHVPFLIRLRSYSNGNFPKPSEFVDSVARTISDYMPGGWVNRKLRDEKCIILIDGVDEVPQPIRKKAKKWLIELMDEYPKPIYIVSSRPTAIDYNWLTGHSFSSCFIQDLTRSDVQKFLKHWHQSCEKNLLEGSVNVGRYMKKLNATILDTPAVRNLTTSPLLLAMLCALNIDRKSHIPKDRMELYRVVLETLLEKRDVEREIEENIDLTRKEKEVLLQDLAYWLLINNYVDCEVPDAISRIQKEIINIQRITDFEASSVFLNLLERSGLLREPVVGRVNFIHKTFQEYLSAAEIIQENSIGVLLDKCSSDQWSEVIVLAAGHANDRQRDQIIKGLLAKATNRKKDEKKIKMLALSCIETSTKISTKTMTLLKDTLAELFPPINTQDAKELALAGDSVIGPLLGYNNSDPKTIVLCIKCLRYLGTDNAMYNMKHFCGSSNQFVSKEIILAWDYFNQFQFGLHVLKYSGIEGPVKLSEMDSLSGIEFLNDLKILEIEDSDLSDVSTLGQLKNLEELVIINCDCVDLDHLGDLENVKVLTISECHNIEDFSFLGEMTSLEYLNIGDCQEFTNLEILASLSELVYLDVRNCVDLENIYVFEDLIKLQKVALPSLLYVDTLSFESQNAIDFV